MTSASQAMDDTPPPPVRGQGTRVVVLVAAVMTALFYAFLLLGRFDLGNGHHTGLDTLLLHAINLTVWIGVGVILLGALRYNDLGRWLKWLLPILWFAACWATYRALDVLHDAPPEKDWLEIVPEALPLILAALGLILALGRGLGRTLRIAITAVATLAALSLIFISFAEAIAWDVAEPERIAQWEREQQSTDYQARLRLQEDQALVESFGPDTRLDDVLPLLSGVTLEEATAKVRTLTNRQADAERLLVSADHLGAFARLSLFDVRATPALCAAYRERDEWNRANGMGGQSATIRWLRANGCDLAPQIRHHHDVIVAAGQDPARFDALMSMNAPVAPESTNGAAAR